MNRWVLYLFCIWLSFIAISVAGAQLVWNRTGPVAPSILKVIPDRSHPGIWYLLTATGYYYSSQNKLYRSIDNGQSWEYTRIKDVVSVLVQSASSELIVTRRGRDYKYDLLASSDFGRTFHLRTGNAPRFVFDHPSDPRVLWGSGVDNYYDLSVSYDKGAHWQGFTNLPYRFDKTYDIDGEPVSPDGYTLNSVLVSPFDPSTIFVSTEVEFPLGCSGEYFDLELVSTNSGKSWSFEERPIGNYVYDPVFQNRAFFLSYDETRVLTQKGWKTLPLRELNDVVSVPDNFDKLYALSGTRQWASHDGGDSWSRTFIGPGGRANLLQARSDPEGSLIAGTSGAGVYIIDKTGVTHPVTDGFSQARVTDIATAPASNIVFAVTGIADFFLYRSSNSGKTWRNITDNLPVAPAANSYPHVLVNQKNPKHVFMTINDRIAVSFDAGDTWVFVPQKPLVGVFFDHDFTNVYFAKPADGHLYKSTDGGLTLQQLPALFGSAKNRINDLEVDRFSGYLYVATETGLFVSRDQGRTATQIATELSPDCLSCLQFMGITALPLRGQYIVSTANGLYKSVNQGVSWQLLSQFEGQVYVADDKGQHLFMVDRFLWESHDGGSNWDRISASIDPELSPGHYEEIFAISDPRYRPLYVATTIGMYVTQE